MRYGSMITLCHQKKRMGYGSMEFGMGYGFGIGMGYGSIEFGMGYGIWDWNGIWDIELLNSHRL